MKNIDRLRMFIKFMIVGGIFILAAFSYMLIEIH